MTTSERAYYTIKANGLLSKRQFQVYEALYEFGPMTAAEVSKYVPGAWKRLSELVSAGVVSEAACVTDPVTRQKVTLYELTAAVPMKLPRPRSRCELIKEIAMLRARLSQYETVTI